MTPPADIAIERDARAPWNARRAVEDFAASIDPELVPVARDRPATEAGGWGLHLVETLTDRCGVHVGSTHVWFEIDRT